MEAKERRVLRRLRSDYRFYAEHCLKIRLKKAITVGDGEITKIAPFLFNRAQSHANALMDVQKYETGRVRVLLLKGRQQGMSTLIGGRYYHLTTHNKGIKTFILTHLEDATNNLFAMVKRFHELNLPEMKPHTKYSNKRELLFDYLDSSYGLGTAGSGEVGRSDTIDLLHGSEVAVWKNTDDIRSGILQSAEAAQEIVLESTAKGMGNMFHSMWQDAEAGLSDYRAIFIPWFWQDEYTRELPEGWEMEDSEKEYLRQFKGNGCTERHIAWRRFKIRELGSAELTDQEYPPTSNAAFSHSETDSFIKPQCVLKCRKEVGHRGVGAHVVGLDPARGGDRTSIIHRRGREAYNMESFLSPDTNLIIGKVRELMENDSDFIDRLFIDIGGLGGPLYDIMRSMAFGNRITAVNFGSRDVYDPERYYNKRAEMWGDMKSWLMDENLPAIIPDSDELQADLCGPGYKTNHLQQYLLESKDDIRKRGGRSPDTGDALCLTFSQSVASQSEMRRIHHKSYSI